MSSSTPQTRVRDSRFVLIGGGGLGGPLAYALAAADAGELVLVDDDRVELSNLQRQIQFVTDDIGQPKAEKLAGELVRRGFPRNRLVVHNSRFTLERAPARLPGATVVIDGSDNLTTKFAVNDACVAAGIPCVIGGVLRHSGQVLTVLPGRSGCYRCLFEEAPPDADVDSCAEAGVLGAVVAVIAGVMARCALSLAAGRPDNVGALLVFEDVVQNPTPRRVAFQRRASCAICSAYAEAKLASPLQPQ